MTLNKEKDQQVSVFHAPTSRRNVTAKSKLKGPFVEDDNRVNCMDRFGYQIGHQEILL